MKPKIRTYIVGTAILGILASVLIAKESEAKKLTDSERTQFLKFRNASATSMFAAYATFPGGIKSADVLGVDREMHSYAQHVFVENECPSQEYITKNVVCIPHDEFARQRGIDSDVAFLKFSDGENDFMLVVAGGLQGQVYVFISPVNEKLQGEVNVVTQLQGMAVARQGNSMAILRGSPALVSTHVLLPSRFTPPNCWFERTRTVYKNENPATTGPSTTLATQPAARK